MVSVNSMWCSILIHSKLTEIFDIEIFWCKGCWEGSYYNYNILFNYYIKAGNQKEKTFYIMLLFKVLYAMYTYWFTILSLFDKKFCRRSTMN